MFFKLLYFLPILVATWCCSVVSASFPEDPKPCKYEDSECILKIINYYLHNHSKGENSINMLAIDPLEVPRLTMKQGGESPVSIDLTFTNNKIRGFKQANAFKIKGFGKDLTQKHEIHMESKVISMDGDYKIGGKVLILPIAGTGQSNITLVNVVLSIYFSGTPVEKDGSTYMKITNMRINVQPERLYFNFSNLFNGDKALGDNMNLFLNENWKDIFNEIKNSLHLAFAKVYQNVVTTVFTKYPYDKYFTE